MSLCRYLDVHNCMVRNAALDNLIFLEEFISSKQLNNSVLQKMMTSCSKLYGLNINSSQYLTSVCTEALVGSAGRLLKLSMAYCPFVTDEVVSQIISVATKLELLDVSGKQTESLLNEL